MQPVFEELDFQKTPLGDISLRKRSEPRLDNVIIYEVKLNEEFLMSSLFTEAEIQLSNLGLAEVLKTFNLDNKLDIVVGGLGLGYTAAAALKNPAVHSLHVIDVMAPVISWHQNGLIPLGRELISDTRCKLIHADFYQMAAEINSGFNIENPTQLAHAILLDIDHSPSHLLNSKNGAFYTQAGLEQLATKLHSGGVFGLWSNEPPDQQFLDLLNSAFHSASSHLITFPNPYTGDESANTIYLANKA